jgi:adenosylmethionine-8-amino-7-oxononanoate aminotransferase
MRAGEETRLWHPFADMGAVRQGELVIERGEDVWVWDSEGRRYLDATASLWYANVGHGRPEIAARWPTRWRDWRPTQRSVISPTSRH